MNQPRPKPPRRTDGDRLPPMSEITPDSVHLRSELPGEITSAPLIDAREYEESFGCSLDQTLNLDQWRSDLYLSADWERIEQELSEALEQQKRTIEPIRQTLFPMIASRPHAPKGAGVFQATMDQLQRIQVNVLFNGGVEACDGTCVVHDTLPLTITQIGVCLVSYQGEHGAWGHRLFRRDLRLRGQDPLEEALELLNRRELRGGLEQESSRDRLSELARRGIMSYAERAILLHKSKAPWRMGHGHPAPYELLYAYGSMDLLRLSLEMLSELIFQHRRFVFVPSSPGERLLLEIGYALRPLEFAIVETSQRRMEQMIQTKGHLRGEYREQVEAFTKEAGDEILVGVYRTYAEAPPQIFYAHADFAQEAALIAMADSLLQPQRAFPTLIDLADTVCSGLFGGEGFNSVIQSAYATQGSPLRYFGERETRR